MSVPTWVDYQFSKDLPVLRAKGEGQELEFKVEFPQQTSDLAKEIAAFATSNTGIIILGVKDNGDIVGLTGMDDPQERDHLLRRLEGICSSSVKPAVTPRVHWAMETNLVVLIISVPKGSEPIYYSQGKPYLRHITSSRPAEPHEVVERIRHYLSSRLENPESDESNEETDFYTRLASILVRILVWRDIPIDERHLNPSLDEWRSECAQAASNLREMATTDIAVHLELDESMREVADSLEEFASFQLYLGGGEELEAVEAHAIDLVDKFKQRTIDPLPLSDTSIIQAKTLIRENSRRLTDLAIRAEQMVNNGRIDEVTSEIGLIGSQLMQLSAYNGLRVLGRNLLEQLRQIGVNLRLLEMERIYMDGGVSMRRLIEGISECAGKLSILAAEMQVDS